MDYILHDAIRDSGLTHICITYDIFCRYYIKLLERAKKNFPPEMTEVLRTATIRGFVPKFHLPAHGPSCQTRWSLNFGSGVGRLDGEAPERNWVENNELAKQTFEMTKGGRHGVLDDHFNNLNQRRANALREWVVDMLLLNSAHAWHLGTLLAARLDDARAWAPLHRAAAKAIAASNPTALVEWEKIIVEWEKNPGAKGVKDPYNEPDTGASFDA
jgi:hypothetical protein